MKAIFQSCFTVAAILLISGCGPTSYSAEWYVDHPKEAMEEAEKCDSVIGVRGEVMRTAERLESPEKCAQADKAMEQLKPSNRVLQIPN